MGENQKESLTRVLGRVTETVPLISLIGYLPEDGDVKTPTAVLHLKRTP